MFLMIPFSLMFQWAESVFLGDRMYRSYYSGFGATAGVITRKIEAPMANRVLMAWLLYGTDQVFKLFGKRLIWNGDSHGWAYVFWKWLLACCALMLQAHLFGFASAVFLMLAWLLVLQFDYWCVYAEALCFLLALTGNLPLALVGCVIGPLSRESTLMSPALYLFTTADPIGGGICFAVWFGVWLVKKRWVGSPEWYTATLAIWGNLLWRWWMKALPFRIPYLAFSLVLGAMCLIIQPHYQLLPHTLEITYWAVPTLLLMGGLIVGFMWETRTIINVMIWVGPLLLRLMQ